MLLEAYKRHFAEILKQKINLSLDEILQLIEIPPENIPGDFAFPCFQIAKPLKKSPVQIATEIKTWLKSNFFSSFENLGPYVNAHINQAQFTKDFFWTKNRNPVEYWNEKTRVLIEYMWANPNKPLHIGHVRNVCVGDSLRRIFKFLWYDLTASTYGDDSGVNVWYNIVGHLYYGLPTQTDKKFDHYCGEVYTQMKAKDEDPEFKKILSETLLKIEEGTDGEVYRIHQEYTKKCAWEQIKTCRRMNASFDVINRETDILHLKFFAEAMDLLREKWYVKFAEEGEAAGCWIIDLSSLPEYQKEEKQYQILIKSDGVATYIAKDIAFAMRKLWYLSKDFWYKVFTHQPDGSIIYSTHAGEESDIKDKFWHYNMAITVIDNRQIPVQEVVKSSLKLLWYLTKNKQYMPLGYGIVYLTPKTLMSFGYELTEEEKLEKRLPFASRKGRTVTVDEMMTILHEKAYRETKERNPEKDAERLDEVSEKIAVWSLRFFLIKWGIEKDIVFDVDEVMDMQWESGAYILYTGARIQSIIDHSEVTKKSANNEKLLVAEEEFNLVKILSEFESMIIQSQKELAPHIVCRYLMRLCSLMNSYYANVKILKSEEPLKSARINLLKKSIEVLKKAMNLIGMEFLERM